MVQVIGEDESLKKKVSCGNCASILEYAKNDVQEVEDSHFTQLYPELIKFIKCPKCRAHVPILD